MSKYERETKYDEIEILNRGANFSADRVHRFVLWRTWDEDKPQRLWIMLNPSTADETENDPTVERCFRRSVDDGFGAITVCNLFALRSTDPKLLYKHADPVGDINDEVILRTAMLTHDGGGQVVCGWGQHGKIKQRGKIVMTNLLGASLPLHVLGMTKTDQPIHPLYVKYELKPYQIFSR